MAISPASGALSQTQLAELEQIRALRTAKATASAQATESIGTKPVASRPAPAQPPATANAANSAPTNRARGSILNITV